ncbi:Phosphohydrolase (MutT/nudix family protein) [Bacillus sp. ZZV12-4809]|nr:Phosphohydrolase (MutT/nudix family protein) [Bacillus sp. ZZV12-4809]
MGTKYKNLITTKEEFASFRAEIGQPSARAAAKVIPFIDEHCIDFISKSAFLTLSTSDAAGKCDVSPRGDSPGFVTVLDEQHLFIPERPGNRRMDTVIISLKTPILVCFFLYQGLAKR